MELVKDQHIGTEACHLEAIHIGKRSLGKCFPLKTLHPTKHHTQSIILSQKFKGVVELRTGLPGGLRGGGETNILVKTRQCGVVKKE